MITGKLRYKKNFDRITARIEDTLATNTQSASRDTAHEIVKTIRSSWSASPSAPNQPPAVQSGVLDDGISVEKQGRDLLGKFQGKTAIVTFIVFDTSANNRGQYALAVEDGNRITGAEPRPFLEPAIDAHVDTYIQEIKFRKLT